MSKHEANEPAEAVPKRLKTDASQPGSQSERASDPFFRSVGSLAQATDALPDDHQPSTEAAANGNGATTEESHPVEQIESLCMECHEQGMTRMMLTTIPYFREVIIVSFRCEFCGHTNNEVQSAGMIQERGSTYTVQLTAPVDLNRQVVKSASASIVIPSLALTIPPGKGQFTTIESIMQATIDDLEFQQPARRNLTPDVADKIDALIQKLQELLLGREEGQAFKPFTVRLDDPSGNSYLETLNGFNDPKWSKREYERSQEQDIQLGLAEAGSTATQADTHGVAQETTLTDDYKPENPDEVLSFPTTCSSCGSMLETFMKTVNIPHFKEVILMSTNCHSCGYRDNEIKSGGAIASQGRKVTLQVEDAEDLSRDILKSETAGLEIPEVDLYLHPGTLGGRFTTLEGLLNQVYEELDAKVFARGDSALQGAQDMTAMEQFLIGLKSAMTASKPFTVILDDPLSNSYIQNPYAPDDDPKMIVEVYDRSHEQNEELGLNDIKVTGYEGEAEAHQARETEDAQMAAS
ncbi:uncharacterized protein L969DRAFT_86413 [Mixia osmundae IAM 14324]|uniref:Zinc finger ZPR1-type domain-containing protein n=1 Tax=Mixia osmundae (strain CBS 9802 / IAM 14324 / JCM 22182 / KY 12970) TaxID=764103 RepID=G7E982_MIXOS|nr:uncharacterized protein L969DRAFT_86413 [Mixia osmundae IAM 14324]KEI39824.1 hypothetical protein L969DRAFT_86413 [Mixia osmundae IAM 14324]GAA99201.1 hypothetical protein E5Q_05894 [Mixia osmundae IAM 14324]